MLGADRDSRIRAIVVGTGVIGRVHIDALRRNDVEVVSVVASSAARSAEAAKEFGVSRGDPNLKTALASASADSVHICTPNNQHYGMARDSIDAGKHVVCEKPLTLTALEAADLHRRAIEKGVVNAVCFNNRFYPLVQEVVAHRRSDKLGEIFAIRASILDDGLWGFEDAGWRLDRDVGGASVVTSTTGSHLLDLASFVLGSRVESVCADFGVIVPARIRALPRGTSSSNNQVGGEEIAHLLVRFRSGAQGLLSLSAMAAGHPYQVKFELDARKCGMGWDSERPSELWIGHRDRPNEVVLPDSRQMIDGSDKYLDMPGAYREGFSDTFRLFFKRVYADIARGPNERSNDDYPTFADGYTGLIVHEAVMESVKTRGWVDINWDALDM